MILLGYYPPSGEVSGVRLDRANHNWLTATRMVQGALGRNYFDFDPRLVEWNTAWGESFGEASFAAHYFFRQRYVVSTA